jgi:hypothetical protein
VAGLLKKATIVVTAIFIILDLNEKTGWTERNTKREFFGHIDVFFGSEKSIKKAVKSVRNCIPDAKRIGVKIDYEIIRRCAIQLQRRDVCFIPITSRYLAQPASVYSSDGPVAHQNGHSWHGYRQCRAVVVAQRRELVS